MVSSRSRTTHNSFVKGVEMKGTVTLSKLEYEALR
jgi:hypothetical protein